MKTLRRASDHAEVLARLRRLRPDSRRRWGRMTAPQMVCHLTDAFRNLLGERPVAPHSGKPSLLQRTLVKWIALDAPVNWPRGIKTRPDADQELGGTPPSNFQDDVAALERACERFLAADPTRRRAHFMFGPLSEAEWGRWAYRHMDHHLRQFGL
jgi:hypothetical protein